MSVEISRLPSGLTIATDRMPSVESVTVSITVAAGSRAERENEHGIAHLLEHMAFKGTRKRTARAIAEAIETVGGEINAATSVETTTYSARMLAADLPLAIDVLADIVTGSVFDPEELARERDVIAQEIHAVTDAPDDLVYDNFTAAAFPGQPIGRPILGTLETLAGFDGEAISAFLAREYRAERMVLAVAGRVDHAAVVRMAEDAFGGWGAGAVTERQPARYAGGEARVTRRLEQVYLVLGFPAPSFYEEDFYAAQIFTGLAGGGMSSRLFQTAREERGLAYDIHAFQWGFVDAGLLGVYAGAAGGALGQLAPLAVEVLEEAAATATAEEVERAKAQLRAGLLMALESSGARADYAARHILSWGKVIPPREMVKRIDRCDVAAVRAAGRRCLDGAPTLSAIGPLRSLPSLDRIVGRAAPRRSAA